MTVRRVNPEVLAPPTGFSHAVVAEGSTIVLLAGQTALNSHNVIEGEGIVNQTAGGDPSQLGKLTIYCTDPVDYRAHSREIGAVWKKHVGQDYPAMTLIGVTRLWDDAALVEIEGIAILP
jgi:enamine deaminase RidA (YjgF/YER057c/UK114 family)